MENVNLTPDYCRNTGLVYLKEVPFTEEALQELVAAGQALANISPRQFNFKIEIMDSTSGEVAAFYRKDIQQLDRWLEENCELKLAKNKDFN